MTTAEWVLAAFLAFAPPERHESAPWADPSRDHAVGRYTKIAAAIELRCGADRGCASLLAAIAIGESGLARDADEGMAPAKPSCWRRGGYRTRCDSGAAASVWQAHAFGVDEHGQHITIRRLFQDRSLAAWQTLRVARSSLARCKHQRPERRLSGLSGSCIDRDGSWVARYRLWQRLRGWEPPATEKGAADS
ncbi:MAG: hypothetical protein HOW73_47790 [Polyangiaceae bacterium]|nr:hypothetical protein [Polyangiaceae bacterium]